MKLRRNRIALLGVVVVAVLLGAVSFALLRDTTYPVEGRLVILDPGHFETPADTGALNLVGGVMLEERDVNWEVTLATQRLLLAQGIEVILTRQDGKYLDRPQRYLLANASGGEVLVSIHHNGSDDHAINYTTTFYTHEDDIRIARRAQDRLVEALGFSDSDIRRETFGMTARTAMPAALTEAWFITHNATAARYLTENAQRATREPGLGWSADSLVELEAHALSAAIVAYLESTSPPEEP